MERNNNIILIVYMYNGNIIALIAYGKGARGK
jgi:hypothetical protein